MAFEGLSQKLSSALSKLTGRGKLTEQAVRERDARGAHGAFGGRRQLPGGQGLLSSGSPSAAWAQEVLDSLTPAQQVIKIVNEELTALMGGAQRQADLVVQRARPSICSAACRARARPPWPPSWPAMLQQDRAKSPLLVACDVYRPAAIKQLQVVGEQVDVAGL